jgi:hypothetical protein
MGPPRVRIGRCLAALRHEGWRIVYVARLNTDGSLVFLRRAKITPYLFGIKRLSCDRGYVRD